MAVLPSLPALRAFDAASRLGSFRAASEELHVSPTAISHHIRGLEAQLNLQLFIRSGRRVVLTDQGMRLAEDVTKAFRILEQAVLDLSDTSEQAKIRIAMGPSFATRWMLPRLAAFNAHFPDVDIELVQTPLLVSPQNVDADIFITWGDGYWPDMVADRLVGVMAAPVASPAFLDQQGYPQSPRDLLKFPLIHQRDTVGWRGWFVHHDVPSPDALPGPLIEDTNVVLQAAIAGQGIVMGWRPLIDQELETGALVQLFDAVHSEVRAYYLVRRKHAAQHSVIATVCQWLLEQSHAA
jgi:LysR family glycine cleavage system transcriptional activator